MDALGNYSDSSGTEEPCASTDNKVKQKPKTSSKHGHKSRRTEQTLSQDTDKYRGIVDEKDTVKKEYSEGSHKRRTYRSRSRSPSKKSSKHSRTHHQSHHSKRSLTPPTKSRSQSPKEARTHSSKGQEKSGSFKKHSSSAPRRNLLSSDNKEKVKSRDKPKGLKSAAQPGPPSMSKPLLGVKPVSQQTGALLDTILDDDKLRFEQAVAAAQDIATKLPPFTKPAMTEHQKMVQEKRKLLWGGKKKQVAQSRNQWETVSFGKEGEDNKFRRLMGIGDSKGSQAVESEDQGSVQGSERAMTALEEQYEASRYLTHIARGAGLGYGSQALTTELPSQKESTDKLHETL